MSSAENLFRVQSIKGNHYSCLMGVLKYIMFILSVFAMVTTVMVGMLESKLGVILCCS